MKIGNKMERSSCNKMGLLSHVWLSHQVGKEAMDVDVSGCFTFFDLIGDWAIRSRNVIAWDESSAQSLKTSVVLSSKSGPFFPSIIISWETNIFQLLYWLSQSLVESEQPNLVDFIRNLVPCEFNGVEKNLGFLSCESSIPKTSQNKKSTSLDYIDHISPTWKWLRSFLGGSQLLPQHDHHLHWHRPKRSSPAANVEIHGNTTIHCRIRQI